MFFITSRPGGLLIIVPWMLGSPGFIVATSNSGRCANAISRGAIAPAIMHPSSASTLTASRALDTMGEKSWPPSSSISIRALSRDPRPNIPKASISSVRVSLINIGLIGIGLLRAVDDQHLHRTLCRFQFQPKLFLNRRENRWTVGIGRRRIRISRAVNGAPVWSPMQVEIVVSGQRSLVQNGAVQQRRESLGEFARGYNAAHELASDERHGEAAAGIVGTGLADARSLLELRSALGRHQIVHGKLPGFAMQRQLEAVREEGLEHRQNPCSRRVARGFSFDVEAVGVEPPRRPRDLKILH